MLKNRIIGVVIIAGLLGCLALGIWHLFALRFEAGDIYPVYSSLRSDPMGTRVFYESLKALDAPAVRRNYQRLSAAAFEPQTTFFYLGAHPSDRGVMDREVVEAAERLLGAGGRLVITFLPVQKKRRSKDRPACVNKPVGNKAEADQPTGVGAEIVRPTKAAKSGQPRKKNEPFPGQKESSAGKKAVTKKMVSLRENWQIGFEFGENLPVKKDKSLDLSATAAQVQLPSDISWHTNLFFKPTDNAWRVIYSCQGHPVLVERKMGRGSLVMSADSFFISNEALWSERHPRLLSWLVGSSSTVIFDETHLGIVRQPSVAALIREYRFHWFFIALAVLALLFVWKNAVYFVPPRRDAGVTGVDVASEKDYTQALIALLRRNIAGDKVLEICRRQWESTAKKERRGQKDTMQRMARIIEDRSSSTRPKSDAVQEYRRICKIISEDRKHE